MYFNKEQMTVSLLESRALTGEQRDVSYLMELETDALLFPFLYESGLRGSVNYKPQELHGGWDSPLSHIRGTFTGHYLSACALLCRDGAYPLLKAKAEYLVEEIARCQAQNGGLWAFPIPEKYVWGVKEGTGFWAPLYVCHKVMMGLLDMGRYLGNQTAYRILEGCARWFEQFLEKVTPQELWKMMDFQESGGIMELWADLYAITGEERHLKLMRGFERKSLFEAMLEKRDVLTNMHANTTIPEIHGAARAYDVTGEERYLEIVKNYWDLAVTRRGMFATGGQTCGEVWTPMMRQSARLGEQNQEHCVVYNMIRLADYLLKFTGEKQYGDYIERNIINGIFSQTFYQSRTLDSYGESLIPDTGVVAYYQPLMAGGQKRWGRKTEDFWCCHCTAVQSNARLWEYIYYIRQDGVLISQYLPSKAHLKTPGGELDITMEREDSGVSCVEVTETAISRGERPMEDVYRIHITAGEAVSVPIFLRIPWWIKGEMKCFLNGVPFTGTMENGYLKLERAWKDETLTVVLPRGLHTWPLADEPDTVAILDGPTVLAGLIDGERILYGDKEKPEEFIKPHNERVWGSWTTTYKTFNQQNGFYLKPLNEVGRERYTVYFPIRPEKGQR